tara:strand:+ start:1943 stop:4075 length:2133 start_codon:yes stop_codon:yes gene_type:complete
MTEMEEIEVEGMTCSNCALGVQKGLEKIGLEQVNVDFATGEVLFNNTPKVPSEKINKTIEGLGYQIKSKTEENQIDQFGSKLMRKFYTSLAFTIPLFSAMFLPFNFLHNAWVQLVLVIPVMYIGVEHFGKSAFKSLKNGIPNMDVLIFIGSSAAFLYSLSGSIIYYGSELVHNYLFYETAATIITLVLFGNVLEHRSVKQTTSAIADLNQLQKNIAKRIISENGEEEFETINAEDLKLGDLVLVNEGDRIPADGKLISGTAKVDESMISGESESIVKELNSRLIGGTVVNSGNFKMVVDAVGKETVLSKIIQLVKKAQAEKPDIQRLGDKISAIFVPVVVGIALLTFSVWYFALDGSLQQSIMNAVAVLVISCPCAMGLATPTAVMVGIGRAAKNGILIKGGATVELLAKIQHIVFDKTGTLTSGDFSVDQLENFQENVSVEAIKSIIYSMEKYSSHPIAKSIQKQYKAEGVQSVLLIDAKEVKGKGIEVKDADGNHYQLGAAKWLLSSDFETSHSVFLTKNGELLAGLTISDEVRSGAAEMIALFKDHGIKTMLLSGDKIEKTEKLANELRLDSFKGEQIPEEKLLAIDALLKNESVAMVGDGINDAPALSKATVGISLSNSTQIAMQSSQVILLKPNDLKIVFNAFLFSKHTYITIKQNLFWAFFYNVLAIPLAAAGFLNPMIAALSMAFSDVIVIGNSLRLKRKKLT